MLDVLGGITGKRSSIENPVTMGDIDTGRTVTSLVSGSFGTSMEDLGDRVETEPDRINRKISGWDASSKNEHFQPPREGDIVFAMKEPRNLLLGGFEGTGRGVPARPETSLVLYGVDRYQYLLTSFAGVNLMLANISPTRYSAARILNDLVNFTGFAITSHDGRGIYDRPYERTVGSITSVTTHGRVESANNYWGNGLGDGATLYIVLQRDKYFDLKNYDFGAYYAKQVAEGELRSYKHPWQFRPWVPELEMERGGKLEPRLEDLVYEDELKGLEYVGAIIKIGTKLTPYDDDIIDKYNSESAHRSVFVEHELPRCAIQLWPETIMLDYPMFDPRDVI